MTKDQHEAAALRNRAAWYRKQSEDFLNNSSASMRQWEQYAEEAEAKAAHLDGLQATEAAAFTLTHTNNQPPTTSAQTALF